MAHRIGYTPQIIQPTGNSPEDVRGLGRQVFYDSIDLRARLVDLLPKDGSEVMTGRLRFNMAPFPLVTQTPYMVLIPQDFGAIGDGVADDHDALVDWFEAVYATGIPGFFPPGRYRSATTLVWDMNDGGGVPFARFVNISGPGWGNSANTAVIDLDPGAQFLINNSSGSLPAFYKSFRGFDVVGDFDGVMMFFGTGDVDGAFNSCELAQMHITNASDDSNNVALQTQNCFGCRFTDILTNCSDADFDNGVAWRITDCNFCTFINAFPGAALIGHDIVAGGGGGNACAGNTFINVDYEVLGIDVRITGAGVRNNTWVGGVMTLTDASSVGIESTDGVSNRFINMTFGGPGTLFDPTNFDGILWENSTGPGISTPAMPASTVAVTNTFCQKASVNIYGGTVTVVTKNGSAMTSATPFHVILEPQDTIAITYSVAPAWVWWALA